MPLSAIAATFPLLTDWHLFPLNLKSVSSCSPFYVILTSRKRFNTTINNYPFIKLTDYTRLFLSLLNHFNRWRLSSLRTRDILYDYYRTLKKKKNKKKTGKKKKNMEAHLLDSFMTLVGWMHSDWLAESCDYHVGLWLAGLIKRSFHFIC